MSAAASSFACISLVSCICQIVQLSGVDRAIPGLAHSRHTESDPALGGPGLSGLSSSAFAIHESHSKPVREVRYCSPSEFATSAWGAAAVLKQRQRAFDGVSCNEEFCHTNLSSEAWPGLCSPKATRFRHFANPWAARCPLVGFRWRDGHIHPWGTPQARRRWRVRHVTADPMEIDVCVPELASPFLLGPRLRPSDPSSNEKGAGGKKKKWTSVPRREEEAADDPSKPRRKRGDEEARKRRDARERGESVEGVGGGVTPMASANVEPEVEALRRPVHSTVTPGTPSTQERSRRRRSEAESGGRHVENGWGGEEREAKREAMEYETEEEEEEEEEDGSSLESALGVSVAAGSAASTQPTGQARSMAQNPTAEAKLNAAVNKIRVGDIQGGMAAINELILEFPTHHLAYAWRGIAKAMMRDLDGALEDLTTSLEGGPSVEVFKQRASVLSALGKDREAVDDLAHVLEANPTDVQAYLDRGIALVNTGAYADALEDLYYVRAKQPTIFKAHVFLGLALTASGDPWAAVQSYEQAMQIDSSVKEAWTNFGQTMKELADLDRAEECYLQALKAEKDNLLAYKLLGKLRHTSGEHRAVLRLIGPGLEAHPGNVELRYYEATCFHALGDFSQAIILYDRILSLQPLAGEDKLQFNAFYQREVAGYTALRVDQPITAFNLEDFDANFKEHWGRVQNPGYLIPLKYQFQPLKDALNVKPKVTLRSLELADRHQARWRQQVLAQAEKMGSFIQYNTTGFAPNLRQQRMAGLAALDVMVAARSVWGAMAQPRSSTSGRKKGESRVLRGWRPLYTVAVRWRQLVEPGDPVLWIDQLTSIAFESGFGSVTPMISGQTKNIRYSMNAARAFKIMKRELVGTRMAYGNRDQEIPLSQSDLEQIEKAETIQDLWDVIQQEFFIVTPCASTAFPGRTLNGTRLVVTVEYPGHQFAIRTPLTPSRWRDYDAEMSAAWQDLSRTVLDTDLKAQDLKEYNEQVWNGILRMAYYWYNFMPLSRGSAMSGFVVAMGLFGAVGYELTANIPQGMQTDWEGILSPNAETFNAALSAWMFPALKPAPHLAKLPEVAKVFPTLGTVFEALSL